MKQLALQFNRTLHERCSMQKCLKCGHEATSMERLERHTRIYHKEKSHAQARYARSTAR